MSRQSRGAVVLVALGFVRSVAVGGAVVTFLALSGAVSRRTTLWLVAAVLVAAVVMALGGLALARRGRADGSRSDRA